MSDPRINPPCNHLVERKSVPRLGQRHWLVGGGKQREKGWKKGRKRERADYRLLRRLKGRVATQPRASISPAVSLSKHAGSSQEPGPAQWPHDNKVRVAGLGPSFIARRTKPSANTCLADRPCSHCVRFPFWAPQGTAWESNEKSLQELDWHFLPHCQGHERLSGGVGCPAPGEGARGRLSREK